MTEAAEVIAERDVVYAGGERPLHWNVFRTAATPSGAPAVLLLHGGGWRGGDRAAMTDAAMAYARLGYVAIAPEYRLLGEAPWPAQLDDTRTAIRAVRAHAKALGVSPDHIFLTGYSAGAQLSLIAASGVAGPAAANDPHADQAETVAGVAAFFPPARIEPPLSNMLGITDPAALAAISPMTHAGRYPPTILFTGDEDGLVPAQMSIDLYRAIRDAGGVVGPEALFGPDPRVRLPARDDGLDNPRRGGLFRADCCRQAGFRQGSRRAEGVVGEDHGPAAAVALRAFNPTRSTRGERLWKDAICSRPLVSARPRCRSSSPPERRRLKL